MSRWYRWYEGTTEDGKFRVVARKSRVTVRDVIALWAFMLEDAAHLDHRGVCQRDEDFMSSILDFDDGVVESILAAMQTVGMISIGHGAITICNWEKHQAIDFRRTEEWVVLRSQVFLRDAFTCQYCGAVGVCLECDHIIPVARGGSNDLANLTTACFSCNRSKRDKLVSEWSQ